MLLDLVIAIVGIVLIMVGADKLTDGSVALARRFHVSELVIGLTIVAFGTSLPEFVVSVMSTINGVPAMSIGNVVGSNLFNTLMIVGFAALVSPFVVGSSTVYKDIPFSIIASIVLAALALDTFWDSTTSADLLSRADGIILLAFFAIFVSYSYSLATKGNGDDAAVEGGVELPAWKLAVFMVLGLVGLVAGGELFVDGASGVARELGISEAVIGLTLAAGGTSLPELATSIVAARKGRSAMAIGNVIGSNLFNIFWILGFCATLMPMPVSGLTVMDFLVLFAASVLFWIVARTSHRVSRLEGAFLVACYVAYITWLILSL